MFLWFSPLPSFAPGEVLIRASQSQVSAGGIRRQCPNLGYWACASNLVYYYVLVCAYGGIRILMYPKCPVSVHTGPAEYP